MGTVEYKTGDIFTSNAHGIGHGVNVEGVMGSGIAVQFRDRFDHMHKQYKQMCKDRLLWPGSVFIYKWYPTPGRKDTFIYNIASQDKPGPNAKYYWLFSGLDEALTHADENEVNRIALPRIGAGVGGLEWEKVKQVIELVTSWHKTDVELWSLPNAS